MHEIIIKYVENALNSDEIFMKITDGINANVYRMKYRHKNET